MNEYGQMARRHWAQAAPVRYAQIPDPTEFFTSLGQEAASQVADLTQQIAGPDLDNEEYLAKVGRLNAARKQAEEIVLSDLVWIQPEPDQDEMFQEWAATSPYSMTSLEQWAEATQEDTEADREPSQPTAFQVAEEWGLPQEFLDDLAASDVPVRFLNENETIVQIAIRRIYQREHTAA